MKNKYNVNPKQLSSIKSEKVHHQENDQGPTSDHKGREYTVCQLLSLCRFSPLTACTPQEMNNRFKCCFMSKLDVWLLDTSRDRHLCLAGAIQFHLRGASRCCHDVSSCSGRKVQPVRGAQRGKWNRSRSSGIPGE